MSDKWHSHFLRMALLCAQMSKDPNTQVGAVIVGPDREVRSTGFNGLPRGVADTAERLHDRETKLKLIVHAEMNAVLNAARHGVALKGCISRVNARRMYTGSTPGVAHHAHAALWSSFKLALSLLLRTLRKLCHQGGQRI